MKKKRKFITGLIMACVLAISPVSAFASVSSAGTYTGSAHVSNGSFIDYDLEAAVTVNESFNIEEVTVSSNGYSSSNESYYSKALAIADSFKGLSANDASAINSVDAVSGATVTSSGIKEAVLTALGLTDDLRNGTYLGHVDAMNASNPTTASMADPLFNNYIKVKLTDDSAILTFHVFSPIFGETSLGSASITYSGTTYDAVLTDSGEDTMTALEDSGLTGLSKGDELTYQILTLTLPRDIVESFEDGIALSAYVNAVMKNNVQMLLKISSLSLVPDADDDGDEPTDDESSKSSQISAYLEPDEEGNSPTYQLTLPDSMDLGDLSAEADNKLNYTVTIQTSDKTGYYVVTSEDSYEMTSKSGETITVSNYFGTYVLSMSELWEIAAAGDGTYTSGDITLVVKDGEMTIQMSGYLLVSAEDVAKASPGEYVATPTFTITWYDEDESTDLPRDPDTSNGFDVSGKVPGDDDDGDSLVPGTYSIDIELLQATSDSLSMADSAVIKPATIVVDAYGNMTLQIDLQAVTSGSISGYLSDFYKVIMDTVEYNDYNYPISYEKMAATVLEYYEGLVDSYNSEGDWYPKTISIPITEDETGFYAEVFVPVMDAISSGLGTQLVRINLDWESLTLVEAAEVDKTDLKEALEKALERISDTDYDEDERAELAELYEAALDVYNSENATQSQVNKQTSILTEYMADMKKISSGSSDGVNRTGLYYVLMTASNMAGRDSVYTAESIAALKEAIAAGDLVYNDADATQEEIDSAMRTLYLAMLDMIKDPNSSSGGSGTGSGSDDGGSGPDGSGSGSDDDGSGSGDSTLDRYNLADGVYYLYGEMVKVDKETYSMSNEAINHIITLTVEDGKYYLTMEFTGLDINGSTGYLGILNYYLSGYTEDSYGNPVGSVSEAEVLEWQYDDDGVAYPKIVKFELISEALEDGYVPLQVFVQIMEDIAAGAGTQNAYLKLHWDTLTADADDVEDPNTGSSGSSGTDDDGLSSDGDNGTTLGTNSLGSSSLGSGSSSGSSSGLSSGSSGLSSGSNGTSSLGSSDVKTGDNSTLGIWIAALAAAVLVLTGVSLKYRKKRS